MLKKVLTISAMSLSLILTGCGDSSESTCRIDVQSDIDQGNYDTAINALKGSCASAYTISDLNYNLATAYMGKAGYSVSDVMSMVIDSGEASSGNSFSAFTKSADGSNNSGDTAIYLEKAKALYLASSSSDANATISTLCSQADLNTTLNTRLSSSCLYLGFNQTLQTVNTISLLTGDVDTLVSSIDGEANASTPLDMQVSLDALAWATNSTITNGSTVTALDINISGSQYTHLKIVNNGETFFRLAKSSVRGANNSTVLTNGYCDVNGSKENCLDIEDNTTNDGSINISKSNGCYACPVDFGNGNTQDVSTLLVDALNGGTDAIANVSNDEDIQKSIDDFKKEIAGSSDANVTISDILNYLNK